MFSDAFNFAMERIVTSVSFPCVMLPPSGAGSPEESSTRGQNDLLDRIDLKRTLSSRTLAGRCHIVQSLDKIGMSRFSRYTDMEAMAIRTSTENDR